MNAPDITFTTRSTPWAAISSLLYSKTKDVKSGFPVLQGEQSDIVVFRIYNNYALALQISTALNAQITSYDGSATFTASTLVPSQCWLNATEIGYGENSVQPSTTDIFTFYPGTYVAVGGNNKYLIERGSDGTTDAYIRAGTDTNGLGFIEVSTYIKPPTDADAATLAFSVALSYEWIS